MNYKVILILGIILFFSATIIYYLLADRSQQNSDDFNKLLTYYKQRTDYNFYVSDNNTKKWIKVDRVFDSYLSAQGSHISDKEVKSFIVAYKNGEILDCSNIFYPLPDEVHFIRESDSKETISFNPKDLDLGKEKVIIYHDSFKINQGKKYYRTTINNISNKKVKVIKFGSFTKVGSEYVIHTVTNSFFTGEEFSEWYNVDKDGWIRPGEAVSDPNNYGNGKKCYWVYYFIDEDGTNFIAGELVPE